MHDLTIENEYYWFYKFIIYYQLVIKGSNKGIRRN